MRFTSVAIFALASITSVSAWPSDRRDAAGSALSYAIAKRQTDTCTSQCAGDTATLQSIANCGEASSTAYAACSCGVLQSLSSGCLTCILAEDGETQSDFQQVCAQLSSYASNAPTLTATGASPSASASTCSSECADSSDTNQLAAAAQCVETDPSCICPAINGLSSACSTCFLNAEGISPSDFAAFCAASSATATVVAGGSTMPVTVPATTSPAVGATGGASASAASKTSASASASASATKSAAMSIQGGNFGLAGMVLGSLIAAAMTLL